MAFNNAVKCIIPLENSLGIPEYRKPLFGECIYVDFINIFIVPIYE